MWDALRKLRNQLEVVESEIGSQMHNYEYDQDVTLVPLAVHIAKFNEMYNALGSVQ
jgi:hypothetical protein